MIDSINVSKQANHKHSPLYISVSQFGTFAALLLCIKFWLIVTYGNQTPYWDQWDAEAANLYKPFLDGTLAWTDLFSLHNEHRIFTTRLLALLLFRINGLWNPMLEMFVNACLHVTALVFVIRLISRVIGTNHTPELLAFSLILFGIPYGWENTLAGFQSQFYFVLFFSFACLWLTVTTKPLSSGWWGGVACSILAFLSLASGVFALASASAVGLIIYGLSVRRSIKQLLAVLILAGLFLVGVIMTPSLAGHASLKATSLNQFFAALIEVLGWPISSNLVSTAIRNLPSLIFICFMFWKRPLANDLKWFLLALVVWMLGQAVAISYGRAVGVLSSRYLDIFSIGILVNFACLISIAQDYFIKRPALKILSVLTWTIIILASLVLNSSRHLLEELNVKRLTSLEQEKNVLAYLCSGNMGYLKDKPYLYIPYPDSGRLKAFLDNPTIRSILPGNVYGPNTKHPIESNGAPFCNLGSSLNAFDVSKWDAQKESVSFANVSSIKKNGWDGTDYFKSVISGFKIFGSFINSESDTGIITMHLHRGDKVLYRSGPVVTGQFIIINYGGPGKFNTSLPLALDWSVLEFSNRELPAEFDVSLIDVGTKWGEWSAVGLKVKSGSRDE